MVGFRIWNDISNNFTSQRHHCEHAMYSCFKNKISLFFELTVRMLNWKSSARIAFGNHWFQIGILNSCMNHPRISSHRLHFSNDPLHISVPTCAKRLRWTSRTLRCLHEQTVCWAMARNPRAVLFSTPNNWCANATLLSRVNVSGKRARIASSFVCKLMFISL